MRWNRNDWLFDTNVELADDGTLCDEARRVFTQGHCHSLALALHRLTGWPIVELVEPSFHYAVEAPDGDLIDVNGRGADEFAREYLGEDEIRVTRVTPEAITALAREHMLRRPRIKHALPFAERVLEEVNR